MASRYEAKDRAAFQLGAVHNRQFGKIDQGVGVGIVSSRTKLTGNEIGDYKSRTMGSQMMAPERMRADQSN